ncbi:MAG: thymidine phosphorylase [Acidobacteria bacterium]|nr:thymidine phosphorylase [Acidobacteriota bacterium]
MDPVSIIRKKRDGEVLTQREIKFFIDGIGKNTLPDYQAAAFLMATYIRGMNRKEARFLTEAMMNSGEVVDLSGVSGFTCDKHSTGGVGDKITMIIAPMAAALGLKVPMYSGKGLGHTGGTIDKLDSIPGFRTTLDTDAFIQSLRDIGIANSMQTETIAPADKRLYALRDVTATVDSIPLITGSIMSKKLACGADGLVLDVKFGNGAFMQTEKEAKELADWLISMAPVRNIRVSALIDNMDDPLGYKVGNALEMMEVIEVLKGKPVNDLVEVSIAVVSEMLFLSGKTGDVKTMAAEVLSDGRALEKFREWVRYSGGDSTVIDDFSCFPQAASQLEIRLNRGGYISGIHARKIGEAAVYTGAGRLTKNDVLDYGAGIELHVKRGDRIETGEKVATLHFGTPRRPVNEIAEMVQDAFRLSETPVSHLKRIVSIIRP